jgi:hypothetical protein
MNRHDAKAPRKSIEKTQEAFSSIILGALAPWRSWRFQYLAWRLGGSS